MPEAVILPSGQETMNSTGIIFSKTDKGREEMAQRSHGLNPAQRRILILIDGSKTANALAAMNPALTASGQFDDILALLLEQGFIASAGGERPAPAAIQQEAPAAADDADDAAAIREVKDFMTTTAHTYLGLLSAPLIQRIEQARTASQLKSVVGQWNMALRDSAQGKRFADTYLEQVRSALAGGAMPVAEIIA